MRWTWANTSLFLYYASLSLVTEPHQTRELSPPRVRIPPFLPPELESHETTSVAMEVCECIRKPMLGYWSILRFPESLATVRWRVGSMKVTGEVDASLQCFVVKRNWTAARPCFPYPVASIMPEVLREKSLKVVQPHTKTLEGWGQLNIPPIVQESSFDATEYVASAFKPALIWKFSLSHNHLQFTLAIWPSRTTDSTAPAHRQHDVEQGFYIVPVEVDGTNPLQ